jgi:hypothetical protein
MRSTFLAALLIAACWVFGGNKVHAQALPANGSDRIGMSLASGIREALIRRGFAANDPRVTQSIRLISSQAGVAGASGSWGQLLFSRAALGSAVVLGGGALIYLLQKETGGFSVLLPAGAQPSTVSQIAGQAGFGVVATGTICYAGVYPSVQSVVLQFMKCNTATRSVSQLDVTQLSSSANPVYYQVVAWGNATSDAAGAAPRIINGSGLTVYPLTVPSTCPGGTRSLPNSLCQPLAFDSTFYQPSAKKLTAVAPDAAINQLDASAKALPLSKDIMKQILTDAWKDAAAQPGSKVVPFLEPLPDVWPNPSTVPQSWPTVGDLPSPVTSPTGSTVTDPAPNPNEIKPSGQAVDLGGDPGTPLPTLEEPPTDLFKPVLDVMQPWTQWQMPSHSAQCPTWSAAPSISGRVFPISITEHCNLAQQNASVIAAAALAAWAVIAAFIILSA